MTQIIPALLARQALRPFGRVATVFSWSPRRALTICAFTTLLIIALGSAFMAPPVLPTVVQSVAQSSSTVAHHFGAPLAVVPKPYGCGGASGPCVR